MAARKPATYEFEVRGMDCAGCTATVQKTAAAVKGVSKAWISFETSRLFVEAAPDFDASAVLEAVGKAGYPINLKKADSLLALRVENMDCQDEIELIEKKLRGLPGISGHTADLMSRTLKVEYRPGSVSPQTIIKALAEAGMNASVLKEGEKKDLGWWLKNKQLLALSACGIFMLAAFLAEAFGAPHGAAKTIYGLGILIGAYYPARMGLLALRTLTLNIRLLMVIGAAGAVALGLWEEAVMLVFIYSLGDVLEAYAVDKARGAIKALTELAPKEALVRKNGSENIIEADAVEIGDIVIVRPGEKIPVDGKVTAGSSYIDQSSITGEPAPAEKNIGDEVYAGTINQKGSLEVSATKKAGETALAKIIHSVEDAQAKKSSYQRFAERFGKYYTPAMFFLGVGIGVIPPLFFGGDWNAYIYRGLVVFVVSCSCGLALSVPVAVVAAMANGARRGILFRGGAHLEVLQEVKAVAFDKTGTLTIGRPAVADILAFGGLAENELLALAGAIESRSEHPVAEAIARRAREAGAQFPAVEDFQSLTGLGVKAKVGDKTYYLGNMRLFREKGIVISGPQTAEIMRIESEGKTTALLGDDKLLLGVFSVADKLRAETPLAVKALKALGLRTIMLTGDNERTAKVVAESSGVDEYHAELLPEDKLALVKELKERFGKTAMIGDGINDAPAMAASDLGIAMGGAGTDIAVETGDLVLMSDDLSKVRTAFELSRRAVNNIRQNIAAALAIIVVLVPVAVLGRINLVPGLLLNEVGGLVVIMNALRLLRESK